MKQVWKQTGNKPKSLKLDPPPEGTQYLWEWFCDLGECTYTEIHHWAALKRIHLLPWEVDVLRRLDQIRSKVWHERNRAPDSGR
ncbi:phage tail assembly chaperone [Alloalcanivorax xenomutans]|uniref:phage tail assembly chaperone n=1 Tax=Alloalcanivorax xenomutans TaxID=1094342 RepID=UPI003A2B487C